ncbi:T9SS type A sorting domain-containing protein [Ichthyenterobacterium sp. W332]|uniref:T9SS type A sorting domain-containing protein n=1 Tax=Microcosmobacter mediterraneus TaxID=3075607 RepID=A0ABU2YN13_9FLAO|nr:T9SS type A sorting domain-containing protein [Ichthyenterobacterium sp. W332]MDT0559437.1 T9SS type A sorting domain-containing protein [Ichthyenterobacterium sp. W332]
MIKFTRLHLVLNLTVFLLISSVSFAQQESFCGTEYSEENRLFYEQNKEEIQRIERQFLSQSPASRMSNATISIPIKAHVIRTNSGTGGLSVSDLNDAIENVNNFYANANMSFYLCDGINYINNSNYYNFDSSDESAMTSTHGVNGLINIYFANSAASGGNPVCGYAYLPGGPDTIVMANACTVNGSTLPHEIGHFFGLLHTHGPSNSVLTDELVDGSNCSTAGDFICDTPADPKLSGMVNGACNYTGNANDANGDDFEPDTSNIMSYSTWACRDYLSPQQYARINATFLTSRNGFICPSFNVDYASSDTQTCNDNLTVNFTDNSVGVTSWEWDVDGDNIVDYNTQNPSHTYTSPGFYDVSLTVGNGSTTISTVNFEYVKVGATENIPMDQDFNSITNSSSLGWSNNPDGPSGFNWSFNNGSTPSGDTGPSGDNSEDGNGIYIYAEATGASGNSVANYVSPCIEINSNDATLEFSYHMFGEDMGELHVDIDAGSGYTNDVTTPLIGQQQSQQNSPYLNRIIDLSGYAGQTIKVRFRAIRGSGFTSDIAIDNFEILGTLSVNAFEANSISLYPNPTKGEILNIQRTNIDELNYSVVNLLGQTIDSGLLKNNQIDVSKLSSGTYFLLLNNDQGRVTKKFIKQ